MFVIIAVMLAGIALGYVLRKHDVTVISRVTTVAIWSLLFFLGVSVGGNEKIMSNLHTIGLEALVITSAALLGSYLVALIVYKRYFSGGEINEK